MGASWEVDEKNLISSDKCLCGQGTIDYYEVKLSHTKVIREKTEHETEINCPNPECPSKKPKSRQEIEEQNRMAMKQISEYFKL